MNTIQTLSTLPEEGFSVTMIIRRNKSKSKYYKIAIIMKCFIKNIEKAKILITFTRIKTGTETLKIQ